MTTEPADTFEVDINDLSIDDIETIEEITGRAIDSIGDPNMPKGKLLRALAFIKARRTDPEATLESVGKLKINIAGDEAKVDPTPASAATES